jgi:hypothetical protein
VSAAFNNAHRYFHRLKDGEGAIRQRQKKTETDKQEDRILEEEEEEEEEEELLKIHAYGALHLSLLSVITARLFQCLRKTR